MTSGLSTGGYLTYQILQEPLKPEVNVQQVSVTLSLNVSLH